MLIVFCEPNRESVSTWRVKMQPVSVICITDKCFFDLFPGVLLAIGPQYSGGQFECTVP